MVEIVSDLTSRPNCNLQSQSSREAPGWCHAAACPHHRRLPQTVVPQRWRRSTDPRSWFVEPRQGQLVTSGRQSDRYMFRPIRRPDLSLLLDSASSLAVRTDIQETNLRSGNRTPLWNRWAVYLADLVRPDLNAGSRPSYDLMFSRLQFERSAAQYVH
jgi:hypothetical protein